MKSQVNLRGHTTAILVLNMRRFVAEDPKEKNRNRFERLRGHKSFHKLLENDWPKRVPAKGRFQVSDEELSPEEIGYVTGVFRSQILEDYVCKTYTLNKKSIAFSSHLSANLQFEQLYWRAWENWDISISPTALGTFVIRFRRDYTQPTLLSRVGQDVIELQESLDIKSAQKKLAELAVEYKDDPVQLREKQRSIHEFFAWLAYDEKQSELPYAPVQWKLAVDVCKYFIEDLDQCIDLGSVKIQLGGTKSMSLSQMHDSYIIHHIDEMWASRRLFRENNPDDLRKGETVEQKPPSAPQADQMDPVRPYHIRKSRGLQHQIASLVDGAMLHRQTPGSAEIENVDPRKYYPKLTVELLDEIFAGNTASWEDELCILRARTGIIMPSITSAKDELFIATLPRSNVSFPYIRYWEAVERMIELIVEIRVLSQLTERYSFRLFEELSEVMEDVRLNLTQGDVRIHEKMPALQKDAVNIGRLAALCRGLSDPQAWSRAEYSLAKARYLLAQLSVPVTLAHIEQNISTINSVVDHIDELYIANHAEQSNGMTTLFSLGLGATSFVLTILILPSFWTDLHNVGLPTTPEQLFNIIGTMLGVALIIAGGFITLRLLRFRRQISRALNKPIDRLKNRVDQRS